MSWFPALENIAVKTNRMSPAESIALPSTGWLSGWARFWFTPVAPVGLHWVRVLSGLLFLSWLLPFAGHQTELFSLSGWFDRQAYQEMSQLPDGAPFPTGWSLVYLCGD